MDKELTFKDIYNFYYENKYTARIVRAIQDKGPDYIVSILAEAYPPPPVPEVPEYPDKFNKMTFCIAIGDLSLVLKMAKAGLVSQDVIMNLYDGGDIVENRAPLMCALIMTGRNYEIPLVELEINELLTLRNIGHDISTEIICNSLKGDAIIGYKEFTTSLHLLIEHKIDLSECINNLDIPVWWYHLVDRSHYYNDTDNIWKSIVNSHDINKVKIFGPLVALGLNARDKSDEWKRQFVHDFVRNRSYIDRFKHQDWNSGFKYLVKAGIVPVWDDLKDLNGRDIDPEAATSLTNFVHNINDSLFNITMTQVIISEIDISILPDIFQDYS